MMKTIVFLLFYALYACVVWVIAVLFEISFEKSGVIFILSYLAQRASTRFTTDLYSTNKGVN